MLAERAIQMQKDVYICFIDCVKAFDMLAESLYIINETYVDILLLLTALFEMLESLDRWMVKT